jgi:hypothetical protein
MNRSDQSDVSDSDIFVEPVNNLPNFQLDFHDEAAVGRVAGEDAPAVQPDSALGDRQAESLSSRPGFARVADTEKGPEDIL